MVKIAPSILASDFANLERELQKISSADYVHVDVMDGVFVPNLSVGIPVVESIRPVTPLPLDVHLMITRPERYVERFCGAGADLVTVHVEADEPRGIFSAVEKIHAKGKRAGVVLKPGTPVEAALPYLEQVDLILVMTVEPGFGGQKYMDSCTEKIRQVRAAITERGLPVDVEIDGGVTAENISVPLKAGANVIVAGSAVFKGDIEDNVKKLMEQM